jgi:hypothetical protein
MWLKMANTKTYEIRKTRPMKMQIIELEEGIVVTRRSLDKTLN